MVFERFGSLSLSINEGMTTTQWVHELHLQTSSPIDDCVR